MTVWDTTAPTVGDFEVRRQRISAFYDQADWRSCYQEAKDLLAAYPWSVNARITEAALQGDYAEIFIGQDRRLMKAAAIRKLRYWAKTPLIPLPPGLRYRARNELFYHSGSFKYQALLGRPQANAGEIGGLYSFGVGAAFYAAELMRRGQVLRAQRWATDAVRTWDKFFSKPQPRDRWDVHCFKAVAVAVLGRFADAEAELEKVKGIIGWEIRETSIYDIDERLRWCGRGLGHA